MGFRLPEGKQQHGDEAIDSKPDGKIPIGHRRVPVRGWKSNIRKQANEPCEQTVSTRTIVAGRSDRGARQVNVFNHLRIACITTQPDEGVQR
jgi:hypothetical protein